MMEIWYIISHIISSLSPHKLFAQPQSVIFLNTYDLSQFPLNFFTYGFDDEI